MAARGIVAIENVRQQNVRQLMAVNVTGNALRAQLCRLINSISPLYGQLKML
jgi:hypothetical protein